MRPILPPIIQGGMGVGVSGWRLARAVSQRGQLGVVSGTALDLLLTRQLQLGDIGGHLRRALAAFPYPEIAQAHPRPLFHPRRQGGGRSFQNAADDFPSSRRAPTRELVVASSFAAIHLAKEGHAGWVGLNLLEKIQTPTLLALYGAMLAGVNVVLMGAGIPRQIPKILDELAAGHPAEMRLDVTGGTEPVFIQLDPSEFGPVPASETAACFSRSSRRRCWRKTSGARLPAGSMDSWSRPRWPVATTRRPAGRCS